MEPDTSTKLRSAQTDLRTNLQKAFGGDAAYVRLQDNSKIPVGSFKPGRRHRLLRLPKEGNYGVIPQNNLFILDLDEHTEGYWGINEQIDFFNDFFNLNLRESLSVVTQSGGIHIYLKLPQNIEEAAIERAFPRGSLRHYNEAFTAYVGSQVKLDADIRSGYSNGYVVGPGSFINFEEKKRYSHYLLANESFGFSNPTYEILTITEESLQKLASVVDIKNNRRTSNEIRNTPNTPLSKTEQDLLELDKEFETIFSPTQRYKHASATVADDGAKLIHACPTIEVVSMIRQKLHEKNMVSYHRARAIVKSTLHCCYDDYSIALACIELGIDKDSYRKKSLGFRNLIRDLSKFTPKQRFHGKYCYEGRKRQKLIKSQQRKDNFLEPFNLEEFKQKNAEKIRKKREQSKTAASIKFVNPRVLDISKISISLIGNSRKKKISQQYSDALNIVNYYIQPLSNVGVIRILLAHANIAETLGINSGRVSQAMRILRDKNIIRIEQKQRTGMAATYSVSEEYNHVFLTKALRLAWGKYNSENSYTQPHPIYFNIAEGVFKTVFTDSTVTPVSDFSSWVETMTKDLPEGLIIENHKSGAAERYLVSEKEAINAEEEFLAEETNENTISNNDEDSLVIDVNTGEIVPFDENLEKNRIIAQNEICFDDLEKIIDFNDLSETNNVKDSRLLIYDKEFGAF